MPRARNLKHDFFLDDELAEHPPLARLFFEALWCLADYQGNIEWREKKLKAQTLPYDDCDIKEFAINLDKSRFVRFYSDGNKIYLNIRKFTSHQNPHKNERDKGSDIPSYSEELRQAIDLTTFTINRDLSRMNHDKNETNPADSCFLIPDSCSLIPEGEVSPKVAIAPRESKRFKKPSQKELQEYCDERRNGLCGETIFDHYETNGWFRGKTKIRDWKACVRTWEKNSKISSHGNLDNKTDSELLEICDGLGVGTKNKSRFDLIKLIRSKSQ